jgi:hypothetical protein
LRTIQAIEPRPGMDEELHILDAIEIKSNGRTIGFIRVLVRDKNNSSNKAIHRGIKEAIKHLIDEGFDVIRRTGDYRDDSPGMHVILENMVPRTNQHLLVSIQSGTMDMFPNFDRIHNALIQHMILKGFKRL